jgi:transposase
MARGYSRDRRERLLRALASGLSAVETARATGVSPCSLRRWKRKQAAGRSLAPGASPGGSRNITTDDEPARRAQVAARPDATLAEHRNLSAHPHRDLRPAIEGAGCQRR